MDLSFAAFKLSAKIRFNEKKREMYRRLKHCNLSRFLPSAIVFNQSLEVALAKKKLTDASIYLHFLSNIFSGIFRRPSTPY